MFEPITLLDRYLMLFGHLVKIIVIESHACLYLSNLKRKSQLEYKDTSVFISMCSF